ncbi:MAG: glycosyltransferase family 4 protein [candidate division WOR-3 bacterium]|nr:glycosyltransferase family 4 protein [candidate division WOR-3 bacterium]
MVSDVYLPYIGGIPVHIYNLSQELRKRNHIVKILTTDFSSNHIFKVNDLELYNKEEDEKHVYRVGRAMFFRANKSFASFPVGWRLGTKIKEILEENDFDIIHIHGCLAPFLPLYVLKFSKTKNIITLHSYFKNSLGYIFFRPFLYPFFKKLHGIIAVSNAAKRATQKYFPGNYCIIPNGVNTNFFHPNIKPLEEYSHYYPRLLFVGRFEPRKGLKYLLQALPIIKKEFPNFLLLVVGKGVLGYSYQEYLSSEVKENVVFCGTSSLEELPKFYATSHIFIAPSIGAESFGIVLLEAMACGKPIVASNIPGYQEILENGKEGFLVKPCDYQEIAKKVIELAKDFKKAEEMGKAGRKKALNYSWEKISEKVENFYYQVISQ